MRKRVQIFIHRWYDAIKLVLLVIIVGLVLVGLVVNQNANADSSKQRADAVIQIMKAIKEQQELIKDENDEQTVIINRQFQALCFLLAQTSGQEALRQLDPPLESQCLALTDELRATERQEQAQARQQESPQSEPATARSTSPTPSRPKTPQPQTPEQRSNPLLRPVIDLLEGAGL
jgi:hypothetical protein